MPGEKRTSICIRLDPQVLQWFKTKQPKGYQTLIHSVLRDHVQREQLASAKAAGQAQELFRRFYAQCFWHYDSGLTITPDNMGLVIDGLRKYGGREGLLLAEDLCR